MSVGVQLRWLEQTQVEVPFDDEWLTEAERSRMQSLRIEKRRNDWRLGRWTAKRAVAAYFHWPIEDVQQIEIRAQPSGAPEVILPHRQAPPTISISHCGGVALCVVGPPSAAIGCDLEQVRQRDSSFSQTFFTEREQQQLRQRHGDEGFLLETIIWSAKESYLKATQQGLRRDTREVEVDVAEKFTAEAETTWLPLIIHSSGHTTAGFWLLNERKVRTLLTIPCSGPISPLELCNKLSCAGGE